MYLTENINRPSKEEQKAAMLSYDALISTITNEKTKEIL